MEPWTKFDYSITFIVDFGCFLLTGFPGACLGPLKQLR